MEDDSLSDTNITFFPPRPPAQQSCAKIQKFDQYLGLWQLFLMGKSNSNKNKVLPPLPCSGKTSQFSHPELVTIFVEVQHVRVQELQLPPEPSQRKDTRTGFTSVLQCLENVGGRETTSLQWALTKADRQGWFELCTNR